MWPWALNVAAKTTLYVKELACVGDKGATAVL